jgi:hypothetical protein
VASQPIDLAQPPAGTDGCSQNDDLRTASDQQTLSSLYTLCLFARIDSADWGSADKSEIPSVRSSRPDDVLQTDNMGGNACRLEGGLSKFAQLH